MKRPSKHRGLLATLVITLLSGCGATTTIDEFRPNTALLEIQEGAKLVVLGRRDAGHYETDQDFVNCVGGKMKSKHFQVIKEDDFLDALYPWFEPRSAPKSTKRLKRMLEEPLIKTKLETMGISYLVWLNGSTETQNSSGSMSCAVGPGGGGCFGFASWDKISNYEAIIWDVNNAIEQGRIQVDSEGTSYLVGAVAPIPFLTPVHSEACSSLGKQLRSFFSDKGQRQDP